MAEERRTDQTLTIHDVYNLDRQNASVDAKLIATLERVSTVFKSSIQDACKAYNLTPLQWQILIFVAEHAPDMCQVGLLADEFLVNKATISDSVRALVEKGLLHKLPHALDSRASILELTSQGREYYEQIQEHPVKMAESICLLPEKTKVALLDGLLSLLSISIANGGIPLRACKTCHYFRKTSKGFHCSLVNQELPNTALRVDCPDHKQQ